MRRATNATIDATDKASKFQSTLSVRRATLFDYDYSDFEIISIHALREESDDQKDILFYLLQIISIHALREESDAASPMRGRPCPHFNPRSP